MERPKIQQPLLDVGLPVYRPVAFQMIAICGAVQESASDLAQTIVLDPVLTAATLSHANVYAPAATIEVSLNILGVEAVQTVSIATVCETLTGQPLDAIDSRFSIQAFWRHAVACSLCAYELADGFDDVHPDIAKIAGLLHDIGKIALYRYDSGRYEQVLEIAEQSGLTPVEVERSVFGVDHAVAGRWLLENWKLPLLLQEAVWLHHHPYLNALQSDSPSDLAACVHIANLIAHSPPFTNRPVPLLKTYLSRHGISEKRLQTLGKQVYDALNRLSERLNARDPGSAATPGMVRDGFAILKRQGRHLGFSNRLQQRRTAGLDALSQSLLQTLAVTDLERTLAHITDAARRGLGLRAAHTEIYLSDGHVVRGDAPGATREHPDRAATQSVPVDAREWGCGALTAVYEPQTNAADVTTGLTSFAAAVALAVELTQRYRHVQKQAEAFMMNVPVAAAESASISEGRLKELTAITGQIAHIFNNLFARILGWSQLVHTCTDDPLKLNEGLEKIEQAVREGSQTLQLLQLSSHTDPIPVSESVDLTSLIDEVVKAYTHDHGAHITFTSNIDRTLSPIMGQPDELRLMLVQVIKNAVEALPQGGTVTIATSADAEHITVAVSDTGSGIAPTIRDRIFDPLFTTKGPDRAGLGLSAVRGIMLRHAGQLMAASNPGHGTTILMRFPRPSESSQKG